jgi:hypothetical protein
MGRAAADVDVSFWPENTARTNNMASPEEQLIRRIHDSINRSVSDRLRQAETIRTLRAENLKLRQELAALTSWISRIDGIYGAYGMHEGGSHVVFSDNGASLQMRG